MTGIARAGDNALMQKHITLSMVTVALAAACPVPSLAQDAAARGAAVMAGAREALGGTDRLRSVSTLQVAGELRRSMGEMQVDGTLEVLIQAPDRFRRNEELTMPPGLTVLRTEVLDGDRTWEDVSNRGGGGHVVMRFTGPGGDQDPARLEEMQRRARRADLERFLLAWLITTSAPVQYAGVAEAPDGRADVVEIAPAEGPAMRLFVDQETHLPLMLTWEGPLPRVMTRRVSPGEAAGAHGPGGRGAAPPEAERMARETLGGPPQMATLEMRFSDYRKVDGILFPHAISRGHNGQPTEEWTIESYKVNPTLKASTFSK
jgi:hypothetical protein